MSVLRLTAVVLSFSGLLAAQTSPRARDLGVPFDGAPGPLNAITDVAGVEVGHTTLISGEGKLVPGKGPVRTGVTAIWPTGKQHPRAVFGGWFSLNGNGEMTGTTWVEESGMVEGPIAITNTHSVGVVRDAIISFLAEKKLWRQPWALPVVAETYDGYLNDIDGMHVTREHVFAALESARSGKVEEGGVGGGTGMICHEFKGGIGTSSRVVQSAGQQYTVGALVQCNYGLRDQLRVAGVPVGKHLRDGLVWSRETGSIIVVLATDAPLLPHQLKRLARRVSLGLARNGSISGNGSGDIFIALSTANAGITEEKAAVQLTMLPNEQMDALFAATVQAVEEAIINAMVAAKEMTGVDDHRVLALPHDQLRELLGKYNRVAER